MQISFFAVFFLSMIALVASAAIPKPMQAEQRSPEPLDVITAYRRQDVPVEQAVKAPDGVTVPYRARQLGVHRRQDVPVEQAVKAPDGVTVPYRARQLSAQRRQVDIPVEQAVKAPQGVVQPY